MQNKFNRVGQTKEKKKTFMSNQSLNLSVNKHDKRKRKTFLCDLIGMNLLNGKNKNDAIMQIFSTFSLH